MSSHAQTEWKSPRTPGCRDAYLHWAALLKRRLDAIAPQRPEGGEAFEPIFVRLAGSGDRLAQRRALRDAVATQASLMMDPHEADMLDARIDDPDSLSGLPDEYALYRRVGTPDSDHAALFTVLDTGVPIQLAAPAMGPARGALSAPHLPAAQGTPIVALIDDGIGFLNRRFRRGTDTRFHAVWLQALEGQGDQGGVVSGMVLDHANITPLLAEPEAEVYAALDNMLTGLPGRFRGGHGTHVLDLAAGADPDGTDPVRDWPLLAVQLPPEAVDDTSGSWFESYILQGLRWILRQAASIDASAPVIVNLSLGISAGPKDGSRFAEVQIAREAANWEAVTGQPVRVVWSFGNGYRSDLNARWTDVTDAAIDLRVQPDDATASYVELHLSGAPSTDLALTLTTPDGVCSGALSLAPGEVCPLETPQGQAVAQLYHLPERRLDADTAEAAHYVLALAPTVPRKPGEPVATPGAWRIEARCATPGAVLTMSIQRDESLPGSLLRARQAHFDHAGSYDWEARTADYTHPGPDGPVTRAGSFNALCSAPARQVVTVGAALYTARFAEKTPANYEPALYTAEGCDWALRGPTVSAVVERGLFTRGITAAGVLSDSQRRASGTSAAAGLVTRALALSAARIRANASNAASSQLDDFDPEVLDLFTVAEADRARLGSYVVVPLPAVVPEPQTA